MPAPDNYHLLRQSFPGREVPDQPEPAQPEPDTGMREAAEHYTVQDDGEQGPGTEEAEVRPPEPARAEAAQVVEDHEAPSHRDGEGEAGSRNGDQGQPARITEEHRDRTAAAGDQIEQDRGDQGRQEEQSTGLPDTREPADHRDPEPAGEHLAAIEPERAVQADHVGEGAVRAAQDQRAPALGEQAVAEDGTERGEGQQAREVAEGRSSAPDRTEQDRQPDRRHGQAAGTDDPGGAVAERRVAPPHIQPGSELRLLPETAMHPDQLPPHLAARVNPIIKGIEGDPATTDAVRARLGAPVDIVSFMATNTALEVGAVRGAVAAVGLQRPETGPVSVAIAEPSGGGVALAERPGEPVDVAAPILDHMMGMPQRGFMRFLTEADPQSVGAELTTANRSRFSQLLAEADPRGFIEGLGRVTDKEYWLGMRADPMFYYAMYNLRAGGKLGTFQGWVTGNAEVGRAKEEADLIASMRKAYLNLANDGASPQKLVALLRGQVDQLNKLDAQMLRMTAQKVAPDDAFRGQVPNFVSPSYAQRLQLFLGVAYGLLARPAKGSREAADMYVMDTLQELHNAEAGSRNMDEFMRDPVGYRAGSGSARLSEQRLRDLALRTRMRVDFLWEHGDPAMATQALIDAHIEVDNKMTERWQRAQYRADRAGYLATAQVPAYPDGHWERLKEIAGLRYTARLTVGLPEEQGRGEQAADEGLLADLRYIVDERARQRAAVAHKADRAGWIGGNRPPITDEELRDVADYTAVLLSYSMRWGGADAAAEQLQAMINLAASREIALLQLAEHKQQPAAMQRGILPPLTEQILAIQAGQAQAYYRDLMQRGDRGEARQFMEEWFRLARDRIQGEALRQEFLHNPTGFISGEGEVGLRNIDLESLSTEALVLLRNDAASDLSRIGAEGGDANPDQNLYRWFERLNGIVAAREFDPGGALDESRRSAAQFVARGELQRRAEDPRYRARVNLISQRGGAGADPYAVLAAAYGNVPVITTQGEPLHPSLRQFLIDHTATTGRRVLEIPTRPLLPRDATARVSVVSQEAPADLQALDLLRGLGPGDCAFFAQVPGQQLTAEVIRAIQANADFRDIICVESPSGTMTIAPFSLRYDPRDGARTTLLFRNEADGSVNRTYALLARQAGGTPPPPAASSAA